MAAFQLFAIIALIFAEVYSQLTVSDMIPTGLINLNTCSASLGQYMPKTVYDCTSDKSALGKNCCYLSTNVSDVKMSMCVLISKDTNITGINSVASEYGANAVVDCSTKFVVTPFVVSLITLLLLF